MIVPLPLWPSEPPFETRSTVAPVEGTSTVKLEALLTTVRFCNALMIVWTALFPPMAPASSNFDAAVARSRCALNQRVCVEVDSLREPVALSVSEAPSEP